MRSRHRRGQKPLPMRDPSRQRRDGTPITKLDAARRQLDTAITLYFHHGDSVSIHTLAAAAHEVLAAAARKRTTGEVEILVDRMLMAIRPEYQDAWNEKMAEAQNFFKHGARDTNA